MLFLGNVFCQNKQGKTSEGKHHIHWKYGGMEVYDKRNENTARTLRVKIV